MQSRFIFFALLIFFFISCAHKQEKADLVVHNARIYTLDKDSTIAEAMAITNGKIVEVGAERQIMNKYRADEFYDAKGRAVFPGFIDAHGHILGLGQSMMNVDLVGTKSFEEVVERVTDHHKKHPSNVIIGRGWDQNDWEQKNYPVNEQLNKLFPDIPVLLYRVDGHAALANFKALDLAAVNQNSVVEGGEFIRQGDFLTGVLIDNAIDKVANVLPVISDENREKALLLAEEKLVALGITTVADAGTEPETIDAFKKLMKEKKFRIRVYAMIAGTQENIDKFTLEDPYKDDQLNIRSFKFLADGALGSHGACLKKPYSDSNGVHVGSMLVSERFLKNAAEVLNETGYQMNTHCIGDSANKVLLRVYAGALKDMNEKRWRIEHAQIMDVNDFDFFTKYSVVPSVQPTHATSDMYWAEKRIGKDRMKGAYAYKTLLQKAGTIAFGTDFPVEDPNPIKTFYAAVARMDAKGFPAGGFLADEKLSRQEAIRAMTIWAAFANFEEKEKGSLEPGKFADFVVLNQDIMKVKESDILKTFVISTFINGERAYSYE